MWLRIVEWVGIVGLGLGLPALVVAWTNHRALRALHGRGWDWLTMRDCIRLAKELGGVHRLPAEEVARGVPGYVPGDLQWLLRNGAMLIERHGRSDDAGLVGNLGCLFFGICFVGGIAASLWIRGTTASRAVAAIIALAICWALVDLWRVRARMRSIGYDWIGWGDAMRLCFDLGLRAHRIPPRDDLMTLPDYRDHDIDTLVRLCRRSLRAR